MRRIAISALLLGSTSCAPPYVWGDADRVEQQLVALVPLGSSLAQLEATGRKLGWDIDHRSIRSWPAGSETYVQDNDLECRSRGGPVAPVIIARYYAPFQVSVETLWLFDPQKRLRDICVRKTADAL
jgi:hypothetical protein